MGPWCQDALLRWRWKRSPRGTRGDLWFLRSDLDVDGEVDLLVEADVLELLEVAQVHGLLHVNGHDAGADDGHDLLGELQGRGREAHVPLALQFAQKVMA